ncbi:hypothetical protein ETB97_002970 [Aspergillus alliaceus]|uniref:Mss4-like protein n=1 Tax=Petromyces alliaceus TaxID=209559 RepID=A0A5N7C4U7_PETAA|nr:Mss4-like protein [Aspergillus alliaceus]KAF5859359.1 hypothetical protein ETB97_002970 [Aspergillus burnettii]
MGTNPKHPPEITGGCLCGAIRYTVHFPRGSTWPPMSASCQCTSCRKWSSSLFPQALALPSEHVTPDLSTFKTYKEYRSSERFLRGFCSECGSSLFVRSTEHSRELHVSLGTIDEEWLVGEQIEGSGKETEHGVAYERIGGVGKVLGTPNCVQLYYERAIPGVTDMLAGGEKYLTDWSGGKGFA